MTIVKDDHFSILTKFETNQHKGIVSVRRLLYLTCKFLSPWQKEVMYLVALVCLSVCQLMRNSKVMN